jgi:lipopolysaccharide heptosyltransferase I
MKLLLVKPSSLGDVVHAFAFVNRLKKERPDFVIDWLVNDIYSSLVKCNPGVNNVWQFKRGEWGGNWGSPSTVSDIFSLMSWIRRERYDVCLDLQGLLRSGLAAYFSGAKMKVGFSDAREGSRFLYDTLIKPGEKPHAVDKLMTALNVFGVTSPDKPDFSFVPPDSAVGFVKKLLVDVGISSYVVFHAGARWKTKMWPSKNWRALAAGVVRNSGLRVVFTGSSADAAMVGEITSGVAGAFNFAGSLSLVELTALIKSCSMMVTVDSGPMHIAAAFDKPIVALFGPTSPAKTGPLTTAPCDVLQLGDVDCVPCFDRVCGRKNECMEKMSPEYVESHVMRLLAYLSRTTNKAG